MSSTRWRTSARPAGSTGIRPSCFFIFKQSGANVIETVDRVLALVPLFRLWLPPAINLDVMHDRTETIRASVAHIEFTLLISILLVIIVVFVFLRHFWATFIPCCSVPLSLAGTFAVMYLVGYTLDNLSLMALAVAVGFVVDDAIVVIENIFRHLEAGEAPRVAALNGARQIGFTVLSMSLSLIAVFTPLIFMNGLIGRLLHEFALTAGRLHPGFRRGLAHLHADDVRAVLAPRAARAGPNAASSGCAGEGLHSPCRASMPGPCAGCWAIPG